MKKFVVTWINLSVLALNIMCGLYWWDDDAEGAIKNLTMMDVLEMVSADWVRNA